MRSAELIGHVVRVEGIGVEGPLTVDIVSVTVGRGELGGLTGRGSG